MWDVLNKIAIVGTIIGIPITLFGIYQILFQMVVIYDMYREINESNGYTLVIGDFSRKDRRLGKKENPNRQYHIKGREQETDTYWV